MMIGNDHIQTSASGRPERVKCLCTTINRYDQGDTFPGKALECRRIRAVALLHAVGDINADILPKGTEVLGEQS